MHSVLYGLHHTRQVCGCQAGSRSMRAERKSILCLAYNDACCRKNHSKRVCNQTEHVWVNKVGVTAAYLRKDVLLVLKWPWVLYKHLKLLNFNWSVYQSSHVGAKYFAGSAQCPLPLPEMQHNAGWTDLQGLCYFTSIEKCSKCCSWPQGKHVKGRLQPLPQLRCTHGLWTTSV